MIRKNFPVNDTQAKVFDGFMSNENTFCRLFDYKIKYEDAVNKINEFLFDNGFYKVDISEFDEEMNYENQYLSVSKHSSLKKLVLLIKNPRGIVEMSDVIKQVLKFRDERDWEQFHNSKDLALAISIEASELLELFLWKNEKEVNENQLKEELADILNFCILLSEKHGMNISDIILEKLEKNALKYPINKAKGTSRKYNEFK